MSSVEYYAEVGETSGYTWQSGGISEKWKKHEYTSSDSIYLRSKNL